MIFCIDIVNLAKGEQNTGNVIFGYPNAGIANDEPETAVVGDTTNDVFQFDTRTSPAVWQEVHGDFHFN